MLSDRDVNNIITAVVAKHEFEFESIKGCDELDDALSSRWRFETLERLCRKWIEQEINISQIKFLCKEMDYNIVYNLIDRTLSKKIKTIQVDIKLQSLESDFG
jgi:hypothetical protein